MEPRAPTRRGRRHVGRSGTSSGPRNLRIGSALPRTEPTLPHLGPVDEMHRSTPGRRTTRQLQTFSDCSVSGVADPDRGLEPPFDELVQHADDAVELVDVEMLEQHPADEIHVAVGSDREVRAVRRRGCARGGIGRARVGWWADQGGSTARNATCADAGRSRSSPRRDRRTRNARTNAGSRGRIRPSGSIPRPRRDPRGARRSGRAARGGSRGRAARRSTPAVSVQSQRTSARATRSP